MNADMPPATARGAAPAASPDAATWCWLVYWPYVAGFVGMFLVWHVVATWLFISVLFPPPLPVLRKAGELIANGVLAVNIWASLQRILAGFALGSVIGIFIGLLVGSFITVRRLLDPVVETLRFIPAVAMITVSVIWFGIGEFSKIFIILYGTVFIVIISTAAGVASIPPNKPRAALSLGATRLQLFLFVTLPATVPFILTGMRLAMANAFTTIVAAELVAANQGIGTLLWQSRLYMQVDTVFVVLLTLAVLGFIVDRCFRWAIFTFAHHYSPVA
jgi:ABC-type nitrate/sulfonate/bicarbonate transport system permease component